MRFETRYVSSKNSLLQNAKQHSFLCQELEEYEWGRMVLPLSS
jgi:hypothetical protein